MKKPSSVLVASSLISVFGASAVQAAEDIALSFELPVSGTAITQDEPGAAGATVNADLPDPGIRPLPIPKGAGNPPMRSYSSQQLPAGVYHQAVAASLEAGNSPAALLPPAPPLYGPIPTLAQQSGLKQDSPPQLQAKPFSPESVALTFDIAHSRDIQLAQAVDAPAPRMPTDPLSGLFEGGTDSLVARAVGSAEGTRTPSGGITSAYYGHSDPGNGVWNMGTFSYQHGARNAVEADQKQLNRLQSQSQVLKMRAIQKGINLNLEETLNGIDLANQSPLASIGRVGYIERLVEARNMGYTGFESIVVARTRSYINPDTQRWNAPGLGNTVESITRDQKRRATAVAQAIEVYQRENPHIGWEQWALMPSTETLVATQSAPREEAPEQAKDEIIFSLWTDGHDEATEPMTVQTDQNTRKIHTIGDIVSPKADTEVIHSLSQQRVDSSLTTEREAGESSNPTTPDAQVSDFPSPTWMATREKNQAMDLPPTIGPKTEPENLTSEKAASSELKVSAREANPMPQEWNFETGATPETKVLPPLSEDLAPAVLSGFAAPEAGSPIASRETAASPASSVPLPQGLLQNLREQLASPKETSLEEDNGRESMPSERSQMTEKIFEIDLPAIPGLD